MFTVGIIALSAIKAVWSKLTGGGYDHVDVKESKNTKVSLKKKKKIKIFNSNCCNKTIVEEGSKCSDTS